MSTALDLLPAGYGYVVLVAVGSTFVLLWKGFQVGAARKRYSVPYPKMYAHHPEDCKTEKEATIFNCIQRAHQNTLENYTQFLMMLFIGGLKAPEITAAAGAIYMAGRVVYAIGYSTGEPKNRMWGGFQYLGLLTMLGTSIWTGISLLNK